MKECDFVQRIKSAQAIVEFKTIDDGKGLVQPDMFRSQVAMAIDHVSPVDAVAENIGTFTELTCLNVRDVLNDALW